MSLADENTTTVQRGGTPLARESVEQLAREVPQWRLQDGSIERTFTRQDFRQAMDFVDRVAKLAEEQDHHPDISISYNKVKLTLSTHKIGGLSRNDFILAAKIDRLLEQPAAAGQEGASAQKRSGGR